MSATGAYPNRCGRWRQARYYREQRVGDNALLALEQYLFGGNGAGQQISLAGSATANSSASAELSARRHLSASALGAATATGQAAARRAICGSANADADAAGLVAVRRSLGAVCFAEATAQGHVAVRRHIAGVALMSSVAAAQSNRRRSIAATAAAVSEASGSLSIEQGNGALVYLLGIAIASCTATGVLHKRHSWGGTMDAVAWKLNRYINSPELAAALVIAGLKWPQMIQEASDQQIIDAVGSENLAAVRAAFPQQ